MKARSEKPRPVDDSEWIPNAPVCVRCRYEQEEHDLKEAVALLTRTYHGEIYDAQDALKLSVEAKLFLARISAEDERRS